jgi:hypothetical protein
MGVHKAAHSETCESDGNQSGMQTLAQATTLVAFINPPSVIMLK